MYTSIECRPLVEECNFINFILEVSISHYLFLNLFLISGSPWRVGIMPGPKMSVVGDSVRLVPAGSPASFELSALGFSSNDIDVQITSKQIYIQYF